MKQLVDRTIDERAAYVTLSRATAVEHLFMIEPATLDFPDRLGDATLSAFLANPSEFILVMVRTSGRTYHPRNGGHLQDDDDTDDTVSSGGSDIGANHERSAPPTDESNAPVSPPAFLVLNSQMNCFHNAAIACTLAAYDGQPLLPE